MEEKNIQQKLILTDRNYLSITSVTKIISLKNDLIQLQTNFGGIAIDGANLELITLDNINQTAEVSGTINGIKYIEQKSKEPFLRKLFK